MTILIKTLLITTLLTTLINVTVLICFYLLLQVNSFISKISFKCSQLYVLSPVLGIINIVISSKAIISNVILSIVIVSNPLF